MLLLMVIKGIVLMVLGKAFRLTLDQRMLFTFALSQVGEFAFVLFTFSGKEGILPPGVINLMVAVVAISMALTPLLLLVNERILQPRLGTPLAKEETEADVITEKNPVIIAGFGHFGNTVGRFLRAHGVGTTILDIDSDRVTLLRKMGFKVYYGDASRVDLLQAAGAAEAKLIIIAIDPKEKRLEMVEIIKKHFPNLRMLVRAANRYDAYDQMNAGMMHVYRESLDTALRVGVDVLKILGYRAYTAQRAARTFLKYDENSLKKLASIRDGNQYINTSREYIEELEQIIKAENKDADLQRDAGWDEESLIAAARAGGFIKVQ